MDDAHKAALAKGRDQSRAVNQYLTALVNRAPKRGRKRTVETVQGQLNDTQALLDGGQLDPVQRLTTVQRRLDLEKELLRMTVAASDGDFEELELAFIFHAAAYAERKGITYAAFREIGVDASVLKRAGVRRGQ